MRITCLIALAFLCFNALSQSTNNWVFGDSLGLNFTDNPPTVFSSAMSVATNVEAASLSDNAGVLQLYSDGNDVYNTDGNLVLNSNFPTLSTENILVPMVGDPNKAYLFRSGPNFGASYSIIDIEAGGGQGEILDEEKNIEFYDHECEFLTASHENETDVWLIAVSNVSGSGSIEIVSFLITDEGVSDEGISFSDNFIFAGWYSTIDDARMSPSCSVIATSHKGHYVTLFEFDNATGSIIEYFDSSVNLPDSFIETDLNYLAFSSNSEYLYILSDHSFVTRFLATPSDPDAFLTSQTEVIVSDTDPWSHIKRGPDENIYLFNENNNSLDVLSNIDAENPEDVEFQQGVVGELPNANFFPNTAVFCAPVFGVTVSDECIPADLSFVSFGFDFADSTYWSIETSDGIFEIFSTADVIQLYEEEGEFDYTFFYLFNDEWLELEGTVNTAFQPQEIDLGPDIFLCDGDSALITTGPTPFEILWNTESTGESITVFGQGTYSAEITNAFCVVSDSVEVSIQVEPIPDIEPLIEICETQVALNVNAFSENADEYLWNDGTDGTSIEIDQSGSYSVTLSNECFETLTVFEVIIYDQPELNLGEDQTLCDGEVLNLNVGNEDYDIEWNDGSTLSTYEVSSVENVSVGITNGSCFVSDAVFVDFILSPGADLGDVVSCDDPSPITINAFDSNTVDYLWSTGDTDDNITVTTSGLYSVSLSNSCFTIQDSMSVFYILPPEDIVPDVAQVCADSPVFLSTTAEGTATWSTGDIGPSTVSTTDDIVFVSVNNLGCIFDDEIEIIRLPFPDVENLIYPNIITVNEDGINDEFRPFEPNKNQELFCTTGNIDMEVRMYSRWGNEIFNGQCSWNGREGGQEDGDLVSPGTYYYVIKTVSRCLGNSKSTEKAGALTVVESRQ